MTHFARVGGCCTRRTASAVAAYKIRLTRASRDWRLRRPRPRWRHGPRASYLAASGRINDLTRLFCLIAWRGRGVRGSLWGPTPPRSNEVPSRPFWTNSERASNAQTHSLTRRRPTVPRGLRRAPAPVAGASRGVRGTRRRGAPKRRLRTTRPHPRAAAVSRRAGRRVRPHRVGPRRHVDVVDPVGPKARFIL